jgi:type IV pilus assembly protein PilA
MKRQSGFTLIELLLVLAIIGIISAIAIPAMLGQRARARDKSAIQGTIGRIGDILGAYDKAKEAIANGETATVSTQIESYLTSTISASDMNPWATASTDLIFSSTLDTSTIAAVSTKTAFDAALLTAAKGQAKLGEGKAYMQAPTSTLPGFIGIGVLLNAKDSSSKNLAQTKSVAIE